MPALVEALRGVDHTSWRERLARVAAVGAAPVGTLVYLASVGSRFGDLALPFSEQTSAHLRGQLTDPVSAIVHAIRTGFDGHLGTALHVPWFVLIVALTVLVCLRWPLSYAAFTVVVVLTR